MVSEREIEATGDRRTGGLHIAMERRTSNTSLASTLGASSYDSLARERDDCLATTSPRASRHIGLRSGASSGVPTSPHSRSQSVGELGRSTSVSDASRGANTRRREKAAVGFACLNCKKAHLACDVARPCRRCVQMGRSSTCTDVPHKRRGRPRLRDAQQLSSTSISSAANAPLSAIPDSPTSAGYRRGHSRSSSFNSPYTEFSAPSTSGAWLFAQSRRHTGPPNMPAQFGTSRTSPTSLAASPFPPTSWPQQTHESSRSSSATLFVSIDLTIIRALQDVQGFFCAVPSVIEGRNLTELCQGHEKSRMPQLIQALQTDARTNKLLFGVQDHRQSLQSDLQPYTNSELSHPFPGAQEHLLTLTFVDALNRSMPARMAAVLGSRSNDRFAYVIVSIQRQDQRLSPPTPRITRVPTSPTLYDSGPYMTPSEFTMRPPPSSAYPAQISPTFAGRQPATTYPHLATLPRSIPAIMERPLANVLPPPSVSSNVLPPLHGPRERTLPRGTVPGNVSEHQSAAAPVTARVGSDQKPAAGGSPSSKRTSMSLSEMIG